MTFQWFDEIQTPNFKHDIMGHNAVWNWMLGSLMCGLLLLAATVMVLCLARQQQIAAGIRVVQN